MAVEIAAVAEFLYDTLSADAVGVANRVYEDLAPRGTATPFVVFQSYLPGRDLMVVGTNRVFVDGLWIVKAVTKGLSYQPLITIADSIDQALHGEQFETKTDGYVLGCVRDQVLRYPELNDGIEWRHLGGIYRIWVQE